MVPHPCQAAKKRAKTISSCQRLVRAVNIRFSDPSNRCHLLNLPTELRQKIVERILDIDALPSIDLVEEARRLALVCKPIRDDMKWVLKNWRQSKEAMMASYKGAFSNYISELMDPVLATSRSTSRGRARQKKLQKEMVAEKNAAAGKSYEA